MAPVNGRPFLEYLVQQLREQGIRRVLLLTGYRGETIREHFGDGTAAGVAISYSHGPTEWETGRRLCEARELLDASFLLLYSDNYAPFSLDKLQAFHMARGTTVSLSVQPKAKANIRLAPNGMVKLYDPTRAAPGLEFVEIGYMIAERDRLFSAMDDADASLSVTLRTLAEHNELAGHVSRDPYHSISDLDRLVVTARYLAPKRIVLLDRDGTINARPPRAEYVTGWDKFDWADATVEAMGQLADRGFQFIVLSNQAGIARGMLDAEVVDAMNARMRDELAGRGIEILTAYVCPHHWDDGCECRKPAPGMFFRASAEFQLRLDRTVYVGDDPRDSEAAYNANCLSVLIGPDRHGADTSDAKPARTAETLLELVPWLLSRFEEWESVP
ncbi:MAG: Histidinol phosphate phosphatase [Gemmatimonadetes bacterium]|nr:Histidinol phosphate phosphatase [Gemmatimonadota bacterium]